MRDTADKGTRQVFVPTSGTLNVVLNFSGAQDRLMGAYGDAFYKAALTLFKSLPTDDDKWFDDHDACPIVFLIRHALELHLKNIILCGGLIVIKDGKQCPFVENVFKCHDILKLWTAGKSILRHLGWTKKDDSALQEIGGLDVIEQRITELHRVDAKSDAFRYPVNTRGEASLEGEFMFDLAKTVELLGPVVRYLSSASEAIHCQLDHMEEYVADLGAEEAQFLDNGFWEC